MSIPPVVSDPKVCPERTTTYEVSPIETAWRTLPHSWGTGYFQGVWCEACFYCGGRKPK